MSSEPELPNDESSIHGTRDWPHAPPHRLQGAGVYFVTARTRDGHHLLDSPAKRDVFQNLLFELATKYNWRLEAWAILSNHYHLVAHSSSAGDGGAANLFLFSAISIAPRPGKSITSTAHRASPGGGKISAKPT